MLRSTIVLASILLNVCFGFSQQFDLSREIKPFPAFDETGREFEFPFLGGLNAPRIQFVDEDHDGDLDLFIQEEQNRLTLMRNIGTPSEPRFEWQTDDYKELSIGSWFYFQDMDGDGDSDLLADSKIAQIRYFRNEGQPGNPIYVVLADTLYDTENGVIYVPQNIYPEFSDIDCDGDFDLFIGQLDGSIAFYESQGTANPIPRYVLNTPRFQDILIITGGGNIPQKADQEANRHGANALRLVDIDGDNDLDIFWGDFFAQSLVFLENSGDCQNPDIQVTAEQYPPDFPITTGGFNFPHFADIDGDSDQDLFAGVLGGVFSAAVDLIENFYYLRNTGSNNLPVFEIQTKRYIDTIDIGDRTIPALVDIDGDGDRDLFLANEQDPGAVNSSRLYFFENEGSATDPVFRMVNSNYLGMDLGFNYAPAFVDIDRDGDLDLFLGEWNGNLNYFENTGTVLQPHFELIEDVFAGIDVGTYSAPDFADIDGDGDLDLFLGEFLGNINFYENTGSPQAPEFILRETQFAGIDVGEYSFPVFVDVDQDEDLDLLVGSDESQISFFRNDGSGTEAAFTPEAAPFPQARQRATPELIDIDADGDLDLVAGNAGGGLLFFRNNAAPTSVYDRPSRDLLPSSVDLKQNYPNPFNQSTSIVYELSSESRVLLQIYSVRGERVRSLQDGLETAGRHSVEWDGRYEDGTPCPTGLYWVRIQVGNGFTLSRKLILLR